MFNNIGGKIKTTASIIATAGIMLSLLVGIFIMTAGLAGEELVETDQPVLTGLLIAIIGSLGSWISCFVLYGFGNLIEDVEIIRIHIEEMRYRGKENQAPAYEEIPTWKKVEEQMQDK